MKWKQAWLLCWKTCLYEDYSIYKKSKKSNIRNFNLETYLSSIINQDPDQDREQIGYTHQKSQTSYWITKHFLKLKQCFSYDLDAEAKCKKPTFKEW